MRFLLGPLALVVLSFGAASADEAGEEEEEDDDDEGPLDSVSLLAVRLFMSENMCVCLYARVFVLCLCMFVGSNLTDQEEEVCLGGEGLLGFR